MSSSSSSEDDRERTKQLQEIVSGVDLPSASSLHPRKKPKLSKRETKQEDSGGSLVSADMQNFLAKKLAQFIEKKFEIITNEDSSSEPMTAQEPAVIKLLSDSKQPISLGEPQPHSEENKHQVTNIKLSDTESSESETEVLRLREAAIETKTLLK